MFAKLENLTQTLSQNPDFIHDVSSIYGKKGAERLGPLADRQNIIFANVKKLHNIVQEYRKPIPLHVTLPIRNTFYAKTPEPNGVWEIDQFMGLYSMDPRNEQYTLGVRKDGFFYNMSIQTLFHQTDSKNVPLTNTMTLSIHTKYPEVSRDNEWWNTIPHIMTASFTTTGDKRASEIARIDTERWSTAAIASPINSALFVWNRQLNTVEGLFHFIANSAVAGILQQRT
jgi:hypothetical protein